MSLEEAILFIAEHVETMMDGFSALWLLVFFCIIGIFFWIGWSCLGIWLTYRKVRKGYKEGKIELRANDYLSIKELLEAEKERKHKDK